jgi:hypothetical protein
MPLINNIYHLLVVTLFVYALYMIWVNKRKYFSSLPYICALFILETLTFCLSLRAFKQSEALYNIGFFVYIFSLVHLYYSTYTSKKVKRIVLSLAISSTLAHGLILLLFGIEHFTSYTIINICLLYLALSLVWFYNTLQMPTQQSIYSFPEFYYSTALLIWSVLFLFRALGKEQLNAIDPHLMQYISILFTSVNILFVILFIFGVRCSQSHQKLN